MSYPFQFGQATLHRWRKDGVYSCAFSFRSGSEVSFAIECGARYFELIDYHHTSSCITLWVSELTNVADFHPYNRDMPWTPKAKWEKVIAANLALLADPFYPLVQHPRLDRKCWVLKRRFGRAKCRVARVS